ncbi:uncharacterized protein LOC135702166 [Ochlerotatus camptorhynchus]|uniref:uncharacterized protein LOC135702166 n=1 Tax=Ochlerotatus camptorhynchus TaxID=644619 RepID=UPI0031DF3346
MILSHFVEKLKIGKRFVLLDLVVHPDCEPQWDSAGPANKFVPVEVWKLIYRKLEDLCRQQLGESVSGGRGKDSDGRCEIDKEYKFRLTEKANYLLKYEFKDSNSRTVLNSLFNEKDNRLHKECLVVQVIDETKDLFRQLEERKKTIEKLQKENSRLKEIPEPSSQEYTPTPVKSSGSSANVSMEYIPIAINGGSPMSSSSYKARKIANTVKVDPDPYTPTSSQEANPDKVAYVPSSLKSPSKSNVDQKVVYSSSGESIVFGKRQRRQKEIFGHSDDDEDGKRCPKSEPEDAHNISVENMFSPDSSPHPVDFIAEEIISTGDHKRLQLPRKTKAGVSYGGPLMSPLGSDGTLPSPSVTKRRRKDEDSSKSSSKKDSKISSRGTIDGWMKKSSRKDGELPTAGSSKDHSKDKENDKRSNSRKPKKEPSPAVQTRVVDREKLKEEEEVMRKTIASLDQLDKMLPEDKTQLDVPVLNCFKLTIPDVNATFGTFRSELKQIFDRYKNKSEREWQMADELCYFTEVTSVMSDEQTYAMMQRLEEEFVPQDERGMYTEFFSSTLIMEWGLRMWMKMFNFSDRREALDRIRLQEEANPMELTPSCLESLTVSRNRKR